MTNGHKATLVGEGQNALRRSGADVPDLDYGPVYVTAGRHKGRVLYYDDSETPRTAICYAGHPIDFVGCYNVPTRFLRAPTIDDLIKRGEQLSQTLSGYAIDDDWDIDPSELHSLWSEKSMINSELFDRRLYGGLGKLNENMKVFLCHSSRDKGQVRMIHDDLKNLGINPWLDENTIRVGESIVGKISSGLESSCAMVLFLSTHAVNSLWAQKEWQSFLARQLSGHELTVLPVLLDDCDIPSILHDIKFADFRQSYQEGFRDLHAGLAHLSISLP